MSKKTLLREVFRSVGPTVIHTFMQVAGLTNDHLISCFRFKECFTVGKSDEKDGTHKSKMEEKLPVDTTHLGLARTIDELSFTSN